MMVGLAAAYDFWRASLNSKQSPMIDGLTGAQRFFFADAHSHRRKLATRRIAAAYLKLKSRVKIR